MNKKPDIIKRIENDHEHMKKSIEELTVEIDKEITEENYSERRPDLVIQLRDFQNSLLKHFDLEEEGGMNDEILRVAPHNRNAVLQLEKEHDEIDEKLAKVLSDLKRWDTYDDSRVESIRERVKEIFSELHRHEADERELLQEVHMRDYGPVD